MDNKPSILFLISKIIENKSGQSDEEIELFFSQQAFILERAAISYKNDHKGE